jgi:GH35 family endo-1,4-beta-xylanase
VSERVAMLRFAVFEQSKPAAGVDLDSAYLVGGDGVPIRAEIWFEEGEIRCTKRAQGPAALALVWPVEGYGRVLLETARVPERAKPYNLHLELVRGRLMRVLQKREDWGLFDYPGAESLCAELDRARDLMIRALQGEEPGEVARLADQSLSLAVDVGEQMSLFHAEVFLARRKQTGQVGRRVFGCFADLRDRQEATVRRMVEAFDFVVVPVSWRGVEPKEQQWEWEPIDEWVELLNRHRMSIKVSPLVAFNERNIPDWLYIWEHDFETVRELLYGHARRVFERYGKFVPMWDVISGVHAENCFHFNFEQLMELTRMVATTAKQMMPRSTVIIDVAAPWGEYYARNQRTIPPMLYADMCTQSGINFDALGLQFYFGVDREGMHVRDMLQISAIMDRFANLGKPLHITGISVPSDMAADEADAWGGQLSISKGGEWHRPWDEQTQSLWARDFLSVALSKPFVETVAWRDFSDARPHYMPHGGLLRKDLSPKPAYHELRVFRAESHGSAIIDQQQRRARSRGPGAGP